MLSYLDETPERLAHATAVIGTEPGDYHNFLSTLGISPHDTVCLDAETSGGIKEIRQFNADLLLSPQFGLIRLGIITHAEALSFQAQNALLKLLEEPPEGVRIILFISRIESILPTILSRCRRYYETESTVADLFSTPQSRLDQFLAAEGQAKNDEAISLVTRELKSRYQVWRKAGYPEEGSASIEKVFQSYRDLGAGINVRLILESFVLSSVTEELMDSSQK